MLQVDPQGSKKPAQPVAPFRAAAGCLLAALIVSATLAPCSLAGNRKPRPVFQRSVVVERLKGVVRVRATPRAGLQSLIRTRVVPMGAVIDASEGEMRLVVATPRRRTFASARLAGGVFTVFRQTHFKGSDHVTELREPARLDDPRIRPSCKRWKSATYEPSPYRHVSLAVANGRFLVSASGWIGTEAHAARWSIDEYCGFERVTVRSGRVDTRIPVIERGGVPTRWPPLHAGDEASANCAPSKVATATCQVVQVRTGPPLPEAGYAGKRYLLVAVFSGTQETTLTACLAFKTPSSPGGKVQTACQDLPLVKLSYAKADTDKVASFGCVPPESPATYAIDLLIGGTSAVPPILLRISGPTIATTSLGCPGLTSFG